MHSIELKTPSGIVLFAQVMEPLATEPLVVLTSASPVVGELLGENRIVGFHSAIDVASRCLVSPETRRRPRAWPLPPRAGRRAVRPRARHGRARPPARARARCRHRDAAARRRVLPYARCAATPHSRRRARPRACPRRARGTLRALGDRRPSATARRLLPRRPFAAAAATPDPGLRRTD